ncbi:hypothetical protein B296_00016080 [Ensete ventricosum]|uniref:Uncharacterized protein n=1 Tax=Ensete ventricosum TaxID=4639 RepID=A0A426Z8V0_ENSVE|nr:hypothetical protein B296_00016080 [Ensete ventricosum]
MRPIGVQCIVPQRPRTTSTFCHPVGEGCSSNSPPCHKPMASYLNDWRRYSASPNAALVNASLASRLVVCFSMVTTVWVHSRLQVEDLVLKSEVSLGYHFDDGPVL